MTLTVNCPTCTKKVVWNVENTYRPFCSKRCKLIDLGEWASEGHKISQPIQASAALTEEMIDGLEEQFLQHNKFFVEPE
jgi:hypothetical protein